MRKIKNVTLIVLLAALISSCTRNENVSAFVCDCDQSSMLRESRAFYGDTTGYDYQVAITTFCEESVVATTSNWPNRVVKLDDSFEDCFSIFDEDFERLND